MEYIHAAAILAVFVAFAGCVCVSESRESSIYSSRPELAVCHRGNASATFDQDRETCYQQQAVKAGDVGLCNEIKLFFNIRNLCIQQIAKQKGDSELCKLIKDDQWRRTVCLRVTGSYESRADSI